MRYLYDKIKKPDICCPKIRTKQMILFDPTFKLPPPKPCSQKYSDLGIIRFNKYHCPNNQANQFNQHNQYNSLGDFKKQTNLDNQIIDGFLTSRKYIIESFNGDIIVPCNENFFKGDNFTEGDVVNYYAQDFSDTYSKTSKNYIIVDIIQINFWWKGNIRQETGKIVKLKDTNDIEYYALKAWHVIGKNKQYMKYRVDNQFLAPIEIVYEIFNVMGVNDPKLVLESLLNQDVQITYVDYGMETPERNGQPIVITKINKINTDNC